MTPSSLPGVQVAGYFQGVMGTGEHARQLVAALRSQGIPVALTCLHPEASAEDDGLLPEVEQPAGEPHYNLLCANADAVPGVARQLGVPFFAGRYTIGFWAWEVSSFPSRFQPAFDPLDEVWVGSRHVRDAVGEIATVPVLAIPQPVSLPAGANRAAPPPGLPEGFRFLFAFDHLSVFERKNPLATVTAFAQAFAPEDGAVLIVKALGGQHNPEAHDRLLAAAAPLPHVHVLEARLSASERNGLMNAADCYVSLHRAEGFGYTLAEAMWLGKPVIATGYSGNLDFMTSANSYLVRHRIVPIGPGNDPYPADGVWAEPDVEHAAALMREVFDGREEAHRRGEQAAVDIRASHSPQACGSVLADRLSLLRTSGRTRARPRYSKIQTEWASGLIRSGPVPPGQVRFGPPQRLLRRALLRVAKPVTVHQHLVDAELLRTIQALDASVSDLAADLGALAGAHADAGERLERVGARVAELLAKRPGAAGSGGKDRAFFLALAELTRRYQDPGPADVTSPLTQFELRVFSPHGEDGVIAEILHRIGIGSKFFVEVRRETALEGNCVFLGIVLGWSGLFVEPGRLEQTLPAAGAPIELDVVSIDDGGRARAAWEAMGGRRPRLVVVGSDGGEQPDDLYALAGEIGYRLVYRDLSASTAYFVREDLADGHFVPFQRRAERARGDGDGDGADAPRTDGDRAQTRIARPIAQAGRIRRLTMEAAAALAARQDFTWHQRFELAPGVFTPGVSDVGFLLARAGVPDRLDGATVLDIGTTNGGAAFECERRGAARVVAVDIADENWFGFEAIRAELGSAAEHVQANVYELPELLSEQFDVVLFWGVLYHLRHPLLALDNVRRLARERVSIETAVCDHELTANDRERSLTRFYRTDELGGDSSNWFAPSVVALRDWCTSAGLEPVEVTSWPSSDPERAMVVARVAPGTPEYRQLSYERPLTCSVASHGADAGGP